MTVYVLHLTPPYKHAAHYIGYVDGPRRLEGRLEHHRKGTGSRLMRAASEAGCTFVVAQVWPEGSRTFERLLKTRRDVGKWCPYCGRGTRPLPVIQSERIEEN